MEKDCLLELSFSLKRVSRAHNDLDELMTVETNSCSGRINFTGGDRDQKVAYGLLSRFILLNLRE